MSTVDQLEDAQNEIAYVDSLLIAARRCLDEIERFSSHSGPYVGGRILEECRMAQDLIYMARERAEAAKSMITPAINAGLKPNRAA